ncbi:MAG: hypothetical protein J6R80_03070 [Kiritimatiellae bacterium]|nr:hypothetical protein [Kiritimatiellia bacterium]
MKKEVQVVAWESGELRSFAPIQKGSECVLALPLTRLLIKMVRVKQDEDPVEVATPILKAANPFPDDELTVSYETICETETERIVIAAALPESAVDDIADELDAKKLVITRIDALILAQVRTAWNLFNASDGRRRLLRFKSPDCTTLMVIDGDNPASIHAITDESELKLAETLALLEAEDFNGPKELAETIDIEQASFDNILHAVAERTEEDGTLNALPLSWREVMQETRFKSKLTSAIVVASAIWTLAMGVLFGVPIAYGFMTDHQKDLSKQHRRKYTEVKAMKERVDIVRKYADHSTGALEIMKAVSDRLPEGITLTSWNYRQDIGLSISGEAPNDGSELDFKETMESLSFGDAEEDDERVFSSVQMGSTKVLKGVRRFSLELGLGPKEEK